MTTELTATEQMLAYWRVRIETADGVTRNHIPPPSRITDLPRGYLWVILPVLLSTVEAIETMRAILLGRSADRDATLFVALEHIAIAVVIIAFAIRRLRRYVILEIDPHELRVVQVYTGVPKLIKSCPRDRIGNVHVNASNGKLLIPMQGEGFSEILLTASKAMNAWICDRVVETLQAKAQAASVDPELWYASALLSEETSKRVARERKVLLRLAGIMLAVGTVVMFTPIFPLGILLWLFSIAPLGMAMGTQEKEFYFF